jgi:23S rRNA pseudouridine2605 synthase
MRINQFLARAGLGSRRFCEELVRAGRVAMNGQEVRSLAVRVGPKDEVRVDGRVVQELPRCVVLLYKPSGYLCTTEDPQGRRTIYSLLPPSLSGLFYVGRLDRDSQGLVLLTNDGVLAQRILRPASKIPKKYRVWIDRPLRPEHVRALQEGVLLEGRLCRCEAVRRIREKEWEMVLSEGAKRQIRRMLASLGYQVRRLLRTHIGGLSLTGLRPGGWRRVTEEELVRAFRGTLGECWTQQAPWEHISSPVPGRNPTVLVPGEMAKS